VALRATGISYNGPPAEACGVPTFLYGSTNVRTNSHEPGPTGELRKFPSGTGTSLSNFFSPVDSCENQLKEVGTQPSAGGVPLWNKHAARQPFSAGRQM